MVKKGHALYRTLKQLSDLHTDLSMAMIECKSTANIPDISKELTKSGTWIDATYREFRHYLITNEIKSKHEKVLRELDHFRKNAVTAGSKAKGDLEKSDMKKAKKRIESAQENLKHIMRIISDFED